ncbi:Nucleoside:H+ symporter:Major facilitator superfamily [hydrothermal vent metagenome]|uniref:Nucleoside:H+ symporter:Major facilitator superfamily n=1 Tax=hydrothermal vent metagenome TaxID=652676 RepID=A0A3B0YS08_9ZZZZ
MYWRLSGFYFFYFASLGALIPYWGLYLKAQGFNAVQIGELVAIVMATKIVAPNIWGWIADRTGRRMAIIRVASLLAAVAFTGVFISQDYWWLALVMTVFSFFWNAALPQFEATTLNHLGKETHRYSSIRLWGSIGFIVAVVSVGILFDFTGTVWLPYILTLLFVAIWFSSLAVPERAAGHQSLDHEPIMNVLRRPAVISLLLVCFLIQASHGPYYTFYSLYLADHGYSESAIGQLWALGVLAEIGVFLRMHRWLPRFGARRLLLVATVLTTLRWLLLALFVEHTAMMIFVQTLHAASFGVYHAVAIHLIHRLFVGRHQGRGQALYSSLSFGAGGAIGSLLAGYLWEGVGAQWMYAGASMTALLAGLVAWRALREVEVK